MLPLLVYDDALAALAPLNDLRPSFDVRCGAYTLLERLKRWTGGSDGLDLRLAGVIVPESRAGVTRETHPGLPVNAALAGDGECVLVNGRWARCSPEALREIQELGGRLVEQGTGEVLGVLAKAGDVQRLVAGDYAGYEPFEHAVASGKQVLSRPWHARTVRDGCLAMDLPTTRDDRRRTPKQTHLIGDAALAIEGTATIGPGVILDLSHGAIAIDEHAVIRPGVTIIGPAYVGPHSTVLDRAIIKGGTAIGPWCKVAGEVGGTTFQGYANKAHDGHLGDSWVGAWANLGAGTTNSNLLNTYGEVMARAFEPGGSGKPGPTERTGEQFLGATIGDHVKTAICTRMMTGCVIGTGTMWAAGAAIAGTVPAFTWATDAGVRLYGIEKFLEVARASMGRRKLELGKAMEARLRGLLAERGGAVGG